MKKTNTVKKTAATRSTFKSRRVRTATAVAPSQPLNISLDVGAAANTDVAQPVASERPAEAIAQKKVTHSYRLFECLKKNGGVATTEQLAQATGLKSFYVSWYMAELKRVYGVDYSHRRGEPDYRIDMAKFGDVHVPMHGVAGMRRGKAVKQATQKSVAIKRDPEAVLDEALTKAHKAIELEFARLRASFAKVKLVNSSGEVRVASIPWDAWIAMKKELAANASSNKQAVA